MATSLGRPSLGWPRPLLRAKYVKLHVCATPYLLWCTVYTRAPCGARRGAARVPCAASATDPKPKTNARREDESGRVKTHTHGTYMNSYFSVNRYQYYTTFTERAPEFEVCADERSYAAYSAAYSDAGLRFARVPVTGRGRRLGGAEAVSDGTRFAGEVALRWARADGFLRMDGLQGAAPTVTSEKGTRSHRSGTGLPPLATGDTPNSMRAVMSARSP